MEVEEDGAEAVFSHRADAVRDDEPARVGFDRGAAVAELHEFPRVLGPDQDLGLMPKVQVVREHKVNVFAILSAEHGVLAVDFSGEKSEAFVADGRAVERADGKLAEVARVDHLRQDDVAVVGRVGGHVGGRAVVLDEGHEAGVLDAVHLALRVGEEDFLGNIQPLGKNHGVVRLREQQRPLGGSLHAGLVGAGANAADEIHEITHQKPRSQTLRGQAHGLEFHAEFLEFAPEGREIVARGRLGAGLLDIARDGIEAQVRFGIQDTGAEGDRGNVPFTGGAEAQNHAALARLEAALVGGGEDAGIEERGGFQRVFVREIRAEQNTAWLGELLVGG